jgi:hypothetical protein
MLIGIDDTREICLWDWLNDCKMIAPTLPLQESVTVVLLGQFKIVQRTDSPPRADSVCCDTYDTVGVFVYVKLKCAVTGGEPALTVKVSKVTREDPDIFGGSWTEISSELASELNIDDDGRWDSPEAAVMDKFWFVTKIDQSWTTIDTNAPRLPAPDVGDTRTTLGFGGARTKTVPSERRPALWRTANFIGPGTSTAG